MGATQHFYKHLDNDINHRFKIDLDMRSLVEQVDKTNYGIHRFISELIDIRRQSKWKQDHEFADELEKLLYKGYF
ncbi:hypothetical protein ACFQZE_07010 [Paenibacillus sp. GCM10027627]|uniref:hypothetical protein n=1 Tax=unclassified Paenibacillus TaxID=185978 RepID=UPI00363BECFA